VFVRRLDYLSAPLLATTFERRGREFKTLAVDDETITYRHRWCGYFGKDFMAINSFTNTYILHS